MWLSLLAGAVAVGLGCLLALAPGTSARGLGPFHSFALFTSVAVVLGQLLPEALAELGFSALLVCGGMFFLPRFLESARKWVGARWPRQQVVSAGPCSDMGLELSYAAFLLHRVGDGMGLALFAGPVHAEHGHYDVLGAIALHTIPVTALVLTAFKVRYGTRSALLRAFGVALSTGVGVALPFALSVELLQQVAPWLTAAVAGLLLHVVSHGWAPSAAPSTLSRVMDVLALLAAASLLAFGGGEAHYHGHGHGEELADFRHLLLDGLWDLGLQTAPMLLLGLLVAAVVQTHSLRLDVGSAPFGRPRYLWQAFRGSLLGLPFPVCACGVLQVASSLHRRGAAPAFVVSFLLSTPGLGLDTLMLTSHFWGWPFALVRFAAAPLLAFGVALLVARGQRSAPEAGSASPPQLLGRRSKGGYFGQVLQHFEDLLYHVGAWTLLGLLIASYLQAVLADGALRGTLGVAGLGWDVLWVSAIAVPAYVCASAAVPIAAVLAAKGLSSGALLVGLLLGPAVNWASLAFLRKTYGRAAVMWALGGICAFAWALAALGSHHRLATLTNPSHHGHDHGYGVISYVSGLLLVLLVVRAVWRSGLRTWLASLGQVLIPEPEGATPPASEPQG